MIDSPSICFVVTTPFTVNGFLINHLTQLSKLYRVTLCTNLKQYELSPNLKIDNIRIVNIPLERKISLFKDIVALFALIQFFRNNSFTSVHSVTPKSGLLGMTAAYITRVPNRFHTFTGQVWATKDGFSRYLLKKLDWVICLFATNVFADSFSQAEFLITQGVCKKNEMTVLGGGSISGVDLKRFTCNKELRRKLRLELSANDSMCVFIFIGRLCKDKGVYDLFDAFLSLAKSNKNIQLWMVGPDEEGVQPSLESQSFEFHEQIRWVGPTFTPELYMNAADVLLLPSYREGFGTVVIEAAACHVPTIAYRIEGIVDAVIENETGLLVTKGCVINLSDAMQSLANNVELRSRLADSASNRVKNDFSSDRITNAWLKFYSHALQYQPKLNWTKRVFDLVLCILVSGIFIVPMLVLALLVKASSRGPVLYWSARIGKDDQIFYMPKFRSMRIDTPEVATDLLANPRQFLTPIGNILRKSSLDELPQLWSILKGDMSFVGPRPALFNQYELIKIRSMLGVNSLAPGLTGWAQVNGRDELSDEQKIELDLEYKEKQSISFDVCILWLTVLKVVLKDGISH